MGQGGEGGWGDWRVAEGIPDPNTPRCTCVPEITCRDAQSVPHKHTYPTTNACNNTCIDTQTNTHTDAPIQQHTHTMIQTHTGPHTHNNTLLAFT